MAARNVSVETYQDGQLLGTRTVNYEVSPEQVNDETLRQQALTALAANRTYIGRASPTAAQQTAQIKALTQQNNGLIRLLLGLLDGTD